MSFKIKRIVLDVLKPHELPIHEFAKRLGELANVKKVDITTQEMNEKTQISRVRIDGKEIIYKEIEKKITELGASIQRVDKVTVSKPKMRSKLRRKLRKI